MSEYEILEIASEIFEANIEDKNLDLPIKDLKNWDSIKNLMLFNSIEESKNIQFSDEQIKSIASLRDILNAVGDINE